MDGLTFIIRLVELLIWPVTVLVAAAMFRKPFQELLPLLRKLKIKDIEVEFEKEIRTVSAKVAEELPRPPEPSVSSAKVAERKPKDYHVNRFSRRALGAEDFIKTGRTLLQRGVFDLLARCDLKVTSGLTAIGAARLLRSYYVLDDEQYQLFRELVLLANKLSHAEVGVVSGSAAQEFHSSARRFAEFLDHLRPRQPSFEAEEGQKPDSCMEDLLE